MNTPIVKPISVKEYDFKQSKYEVAPKLPASMIISAPSGSGKTILLQSLILDIYRNCFARIYVFSPSINVDSIWTPVKKYIKDEMKVDTEKEQCFFEEYIASDLQKIIERHHKVIEYQKKNDHKTLHSCLLVIDDMADNEKFSRHSSLLNQLYVRGRHNALTVITSVQAYRALSRIIRVNSRQLFFFKMRNYKEIETMVEELSAMLINKKMLADAKNVAEAKRLLLEIYNEATSEPYSFLYCNLTKSDVDEVFMKNFTHRIMISDENDI